MNSVPTDSLGFLLHDAARLMRRRFEDRGQQFGLSTAQWRLLVHLVREGAAAQARIAELLEIEPISVSRLVDRMEQAGWVERCPDPADRRVRIVHPTAQALAAFNEVRLMAGEVYEIAQQGLAAEERAVLIEALKAIVHNLSETDAAGPQIFPLRKEA
ncbi:MAG: MarR family transcriptional regulator [Geminicoccaceae bacterium]